MARMRQRAKQEQYITTETHSTPLDLAGAPANLQNHGAIYLSSSDTP
jgi:hypothetical protein